MITNQDPSNPTTEDSQPAEDAASSQVSDDTRKVLNDELKAVVRQLVEDAIGSMAAERKSLQETSSKIAGAVENSQASLMKPDLDGRSSIEYVREVLNLDAQARRVSPDGKARYSESPEDLTKSKIIILKRMGLSDEDIARSLFDN